MFAQDGSFLHEERVARRIASLRASAVVRIWIVRGRGVWRIDGTTSGTTSVLGDPGLQIEKVEYRSNVEGDVVDKIELVRSEGLCRRSSKGDSERAEEDDT